jgi:hypothetical protein
MSGRILVYDSNGNMQYIGDNSKGYLSLPTQLTGSSIQAITLQDTATTIGSGTPFTVGGYKTITIEITATSTSQTVVFEGSSISGTYYAISGTRLSDLTTGSQTITTGEVWQFDVTGLVNFRARISAISGGSLSVKGRAVA